MLTAHLIGCMLNNIVSRYSPTSKLKSNKRLIARASNSDTDEALLDEPWNPDNDLNISCEFNME